MKPIRGFSLVEAIIVVAIAGVLSSLAVALGSNFVKASRAREDKEEVRSLLLQARNHARRSSACVRVTRVTSTELTVAMIDGIPGCVAVAWAVAPSPAQLSVTGGNSVSQFDTASVLSSTLTFFPDGSTKAGGPVLVRFNRFDGKSSGLKIWPGAGLVTEDE